VTPLRSLGASLFLAATALAPLWADAAAAKKPPLEAAREQMDEASFEKAIAIADAALKNTLPEPERAALQLLRAEAFSALQRTAPMKDALEAALRADPTAAYDEANTKPELVQALAAARRKLAGKLNVGPVPAGTPPPVVLIDGESMGKAPLETSVAVGRHQVSLLWSLTVRTDTPVVVAADSVANVAVVPPAEVVPQPVAKVEEAAPAPKSGLRWPLIPLAGGAVVAATGAVCLMVAGANYGALTGGDGTSTLLLTRAEAQAMADQNQAAQGVGIAFVSVGLAAAAVGGAFLLFGWDQPKVAVAPAVSANGAGLVFSGALP
jgi:hypothetical protein